MMRNASAYLLLMSATLTVRASTAPYGWDTVPELVRRATVIAEVSGATLRSTDDHCVVLSATVRRTLKGSDRIPTTFTAAYPDYYELASRCTVGQSCPALTNALIFAVAGQDPSCPTESSIVMYVMEAAEPGGVDRIALTKTYLAAADKSKWADSVRREAADDYSIRSAVATTLTRPTKDPAASEFLRAIALDQRLTDRSRLESVRVLSAIDPPIADRVIEDLHLSAAPMGLKRDVIPYLDTTATTRQYLKQLLSDPILGGDADKQLQKQYPDLIVRLPGHDTVSLDRYSLTKERQLTNIFGASYSRVEKRRAARQVLATIPLNLQDEIVNSLLMKLQDPTQSDFLKNLATEKIK